MGMTPTISNGATFAVAQALPVTIDQAGFAALTYTQIRGVRSIGDIDKQYATITNNPIGSPFSYQTKGGYSIANVALELLRITDAGQTVLRAAIDVTTSYSYRLIEPDGAVLYFTASAISRSKGGFTPGGMATTKVTLAIDSEIVEV